MAQATLLHKIETAFQNYYITQSVMPTGSISSSFTFDRPLQIYKGEDNSDKAAPCIIINAEGSAEVVLYTGIMRCPTTITVKEMAADTDEPDIATLADMVFDLALTSSFNLTDYDSHSGLGVMDMVITDLSVHPEGDCWVSRLTLDVIAGHG
jgi:hypothetical protein